MQFLEYTCGHSTPVKGAGAKVDRPCTACLADSGVRAPGVRKFISLSVMLGYNAPKESPNRDH